jgi:hypothetical protein
MRSLRAPSASALEIRPNLLSEPVDMDADIASQPVFRDFKNWVAPIRRMCREDRVVLLLYVFPSRRHLRDGNGYRRGCGCPAARSRNRWPSRVEYDRNSSQWPHDLNGGATAMKLTTCMEPGSGRLQIRVGRQRCQGRARCVAIRARAVRTGRSRQRLRYWRWHRSARPGRGSLAR